MLHTGSKSSSSISSCLSSIPRIIFILIMILLMLCIFGANAKSRNPRKGQRSTCGRGCVSCDPVNGCERCRSRMFLHLMTIDKRQLGVCKHECPTGYYGQRGRPLHKCIKCEVEDCRTCFTSNYCTLCRDKFYLVSATKCDTKCPSTLLANGVTGKCENELDCVVSPWSSWSNCARRKPPRSCKYGKKKRTRTIVQEPTENGTQCPKLKETKKCKTPANKCHCEWNDDIINKFIQRLERRRKRKNRGKKRKNKNKNKHVIEDNSTNRFNDVTIYNTTQQYPFDGGHRAR